MLSTSLVIRKGTKEDSSAITALVNRAYAGEGGGWTNETGLVEGPRSSLDMVLEFMERGTFLVGQEGGAGPLVASVFVEDQGAGAIYIGLLSVEPAMQDRAFGRALMRSCDAFAREQGLSRLTLTVLSGRETLQSWYERRGFRSTGERTPLPHGQGLELLRYEKVLETA